MTGLASSQIHVGCLVARVVLGKSGKQFQYETERLISHMGPEWVCTRYKSVWTAANHLRNGDREAARAIYQENGIAYHKGSMYPKGHLKPAVRGYVHARRPSVVKRYAAVLRFYSTLSLHNLSEKQSRKAYQAITEVSESRLLQTKAPGMLVSPAAQMAQGHFRGSSLDRLKSSDKSFRQEYMPPIGDRYADCLRATSYYYSPHRLPKQFKGEPYANLTLSCISTSYVPPQLDARTPCQEMRNVIREQDPSWDTSPIGRVTVLQEQGCKARVVAMPSAWVQLAFAPLHKRLNQIIEKAYAAPSCVTDQQKGAYGVLRHMNEGKTAWSVDLSSATDRFPVTYSLEILREMGLGDYADALDDVCDKPWASPWGEITYGTGQPMGLYGSFPLFHLSNLLACEAAQSQVKDPTVFQTGWSFYVLGDDVVFSDRRVADHYRGIMDTLDVPISESKSFGGELVEFAGFMVTKTKDGFMAFRPYKPPIGRDITNGINLLDAIGKASKEISPYWEDMFQKYSATAGYRSLDLSPLYPLTYGEEVYTNVYRGDTQTLLSLSNALTALMGERLPDLSGDTKINRIPMFRERGTFDFYGYNPSRLKAAEEIAREYRGSPQRKISKDPVLKLYREPEQESTVSSSPVGSAGGPEKPKVMGESRPLPEASLEADEETRMALTLAQLGLAPSILSLRIGSQKGSRPRQSGVSHGKRKNTGIDL